MTKIGRLALTGWLVCGGLCAAADAAEDGLKTWSALAGTWTGEGGGKPGQGSGSCSFQFDLQGKVLVRRNRSEYPAAKDRPAFTHEDLMVLYRAPAGETRADYYDNEGHVIRYTGTVAADGKTWTLASDGAPAFRLTYALTAPDTLGLKFEISPSGRPDAFKPYVSSVLHRRP